MKKIVFFSILISFSSMAYVISKIGSGDPIRWSDSSLPLAVYYDGTINCDNDNDVKDIINDSLNQWDSTGNFFYLTDVLRPSSVSSVGMSSTSLGSSVLGVTEFSYRETDGAIIAAKVLLNPLFESSYTCDSTDESKIYIGDVITHELGHVLGLGHSQTHGSTMIWESFAGQREIDEDDVMGINALYSSSKNGFTGTVVGKDSETTVLGSYIQAIRLSDGKVLGGSFTDENGVFELVNLPTNSAYTLFISPIKLISTLPSYYYNAVSTFCSGSSSYKNSFYKSCELSKKGFPKIVYTGSSGIKDLGLITINCSRDVSSELIDDYLSSVSHQLTVTPANPNIAVSGMFKKSDISASKDIFFDLDLSSLDEDDVIKISVTSQQLYSNMTITASLNGEEFSSIKSGSHDISDGYISKRVGDIPDEAIVTLIGRESDANDFFPASDFLVEEYFYQFSVSVYRDGELLLSYDVDYQDNTNCIDGPNTYEVSGVYSPSSILSSLDDDSDDNLLSSCATINLNGPGSGGGPMSSLFIGVIMIVFIGKLSSIRYFKA